MTILDDEPPLMKGINWGKSPIELRFSSMGVEFRPTELHLKEDGAIGHKPSVCIVMIHNQTGTYVYGQMSVETLNAALNDVGYEINKIESINSENQNDYDKEN